MSLLRRTLVLVLVTVVTLILGRHATRARPTPLTPALPAASAQISLADGDAWSPSMSDDARYIAFVSKASNLVPDGTGAYSDVFVRDLHTGRTERVSMSSEGAEGNGDSWGPRISANGLYVAFDSRASNLVPGDTNGVADVFLHDRQTRETVRLSVSSDGQEVDGATWLADLSPDARYALVTSSSAVLDPANACETTCLYVYDDVRRETTAAIPAGVTGKRPYRITRGAISPDGRYVAAAVEVEPPPEPDLSFPEWMLYDRLTATIGPLPHPEGGGSFRPVWSAEFSRDSRNLVMEVGHTVAPYPDNVVYMYDRLAGTYSVLSVDSEGQVLEAYWYYYALSADSGYLALAYLAPRPGGGTEGIVLLRDLQAGETYRVSPLHEDPGATSVGAVAISSDGRFVAYEYDDGVVPEMRNGYRDVILYDHDTGAQEVVSLPSAAFYIQGRVVDTSGQGVPGVAVHDGVGGVSLTDAEGRYTLGLLPAGTYEVHVELEGHTVEPPVREVTVPPDAQDVDFRVVPVVAPTPLPTSAPGEVLVDDAGPGFSSSHTQDPWQRFVQLGGQHYGDSHHYNRSPGTGGDVATWHFEVPAPGQYRVYAWWWASDTRPSDVPYTIHHAQGQHTERVDQRQNGGRWNDLGSYLFSGAGRVTVSDDVSGGRNIVADAIRLVLVGPPPPEPSPTPDPSAPPGPTPTTEPPAPPDPEPPSDPEPTPPGPPATPPATPGAPLDREWLYVPLVLSE